MKLLTKTGLNFISASIFFFLLGSLGGYYFIRYSVNKMLNNELLEAKDKVEQLNGDASITFADVCIDTLTVKATLTEHFFSDTVVLNSNTSSYEFYRKLTFYKNSDNKTLQYCIMRSTSPYDLTVMKFTLMLAIFPVLFFLILYMVNRGSTKYSLSVFYDTIEKLKTFDVNKDNSLDLMTSDIDEFEQLNDVFNSVQKKIKDDYERLKEYTENTSHELQTPLAVINAKLDELIQADNLTEKQVQLVAGILETTNRLSKINQALIFLAKLDNRVYDSNDNVLLSEIIRLQLEHFEPLTTEKDLKIEFIRQDDLDIKMNSSLAHTLIQNLLKNAIRHNVKAGFIHIEVNKKELVISNSGNTVSFEPEEMFGRFRKNSQHPQSLGIGLSIVKRICDISNIDISYQHQGNNHQFRLHFA